MNLDLHGKKALVCGSSQGIGWATAQELAALGASIILMARNEDKLKARVAELPSGEGQTHHYVSADFAHPEQVKAVAEALVEHHQIHILINNTGGPAAGPAHTADIQDYRMAFNQHLICNQILASTLIPGMKAAEYGRIVNVISTSVKQPLPNLGVSNTIRGAVANWSKTLANELGIFGITVNNVLPGATDTVRLQQIVDGKAAKTGASSESVKQSMADAVPSKRVGQPEEVAAAIAFLCSPSAAYINGINLPVDGGRTKCL